MLDGITENSLKLVSSGDALTGVLQIYHDGEWGGICNIRGSGFRRNAATIACKSLGSVKREYVTLCIKYTVYSRVD